jgi:hypothetical protein
MEGHFCNTYWNVNVHILQPNLAIFIQGSDQRQIAHMCTKATTTPLLKIRKHGNT